jgi:hypothetical protein
MSMYQQQPLPYYEQFRADNVDQADALRHACGGYSFMPRQRDDSDPECVKVYHAGDQSEIDTILALAEQYGVVYERSGTWGDT